jgi:hypothetical protein
MLRDVHNFNAAWEKLSVNCLNGAWCKRLSHFMDDFKEFEQWTIILTTSAGGRNRWDWMRYS